MVERYELARLGLFARSDYLVSYKSAKSAVWILIGLNTAVFGAWQLSKKHNQRKLRRTLDNDFTLSWINIKAGRYYTVLTSAFSHKDAQHFVFNMLALSSFGEMLSLCWGIGGMRILTLAVGSGVSGSLAWLYQRNSKSVNSQGYTRRGNTIYIHSAVGASGVVSGMGAAAACLFPFVPTRLWSLPTPVPLCVQVLAYLAVDTYFLDDETRLIGHSAHIGGTMFGALFYFVSLRNIIGVWPMFKRALIQ